jgi:hypothetical protein
MRSPLMTCGVLLAALALAACGGTRSKTSSAADTSPPGDIPDNQAFVRFTPAGQGFSVEVPEGWSQQRVSGAVTFTDKLNAVRLESRRASSAPTVARARRSDARALARSVNGFRLTKVTEVSRTAGPAVRIAYLARAAVNPVTGRSGTDAVERYLFFHKGREAIVTLSGPKGADDVDPWRRVTDSLRWGR